MNINPVAKSRSMGAATADGNTLVYAGIGRFLRIVASVQATARWLKLYDKATAPVFGDTPILSIYIPAGQTVVLDLGAGLEVVLGLGYRMSVNGIDNDATYTAFAANDSSITTLYQVGA